MCVLRVWSESVALEALLKDVDLPIYKSWDRENVRAAGRRKGERIGHSGFSCGVSQESWRDLPTQIEDALRFLEKHGTTLARLNARHPSVKMALDFPFDPYHEGEPVIRTEEFPVPLLRACADAGVAIDLSLYPGAASDEETDPADRSC